MALSSCPMHFRSWKKGQRCFSWNPFPLDHWTDPLIKVGDTPSSRLLTVCSNHSSVSCLLGHVVQRAGEMLQARACLHWYQHYGVEEQDACSAVRQEDDTQWLPVRAANKKSEKMMAVLEWKTVIRST